MFLYEAIINKKLPDMDKYKFTWATDDFKSVKQVQEGIWW